MPKRGTVFDDSLMVNCFSVLKEKLVALAYLRGETSYSGMARDLLTRAVEKRVEEMDPGERRQFEGVLKNIQAQTVIQKQKKQDRVTELQRTD